MDPLFLAINCECVLANESGPDVLTFRLRKDGGHAWPWPPSSVIGCSSQRFFLFPLPLLITAPRVDDYWASSLPALALTLYTVCLMLLEIIRNCVCVLFLSAT